jgi:hypothetical protein
MGQSVDAAVEATGALIADRFRIEGTLGVGGMGTVYRVRDRRGGRALALKQLRAPNDRQNALLVSQFEREYHTLSQLAHPSIIEVYEYGLADDGNPFYTMELLDGQDLRERPQPSWREACGLLRDVASSLAIMHARRLLHRDISARNIRCTSDGRAKLIDFGAMAPMGVLKHLVGTPPFVPPEALQLQPVDGRADLFALGGVLYWLLTRRHAFPARDFSELPDLWRAPLASPRQYDDDVPVALDRLIMQLLQLDRNSRPASAAEVIERLSGIAGLTAEELPQISRAYLSLPSLVGRDALVQQVRVQLLRARHGTGSNFVIEGAPGSGRSRMLDACVMEGKLLGAVVLRGEAADGAAGDYGLARALSDQLFTAVPGLAMRCAGLRRKVLANLLPQLREDNPEPNSILLVPATPSQPAFGISSPAPLLTALPPGFAMSIPAAGIAFSKSSPAPAGSVAPGASAPERRELQTALRDFVAAVARQKHVVIAVDDCDSVDEPSAALLAALAHVAKRRKLTLLLTARQNGATTAPALALLRQTSQPVPLSPLAPEQTEALLRSVFGDVPHLATLSEYVHRLAEGNPRATMELAEHLVGRGVARYDAGSWALPSALSAEDIPASMSDALAGRIAALPAEARGLAEALALTDPTLIPVEAYPELTDHGDRARTFRALNTLVASGVLVTAADGHRFRQSELCEPLRAGLPPARAALIHARIARVLERGDHRLALATHLLAGGRERDAIRLCVTLCEDPQAEYSERWLGLLERAAQTAQRLRVPRHMLSILRGRLLFLCALLGDYSRFSRILPVVRDEVLRDTGLWDYYALADIADDDARLAEALRRAQARHEATPPAERGLPPALALAGIGVVWGSCAIIAGIVQDLQVVEQLPECSPLASLAPWLVQLDESVKGQCGIQSGRFHIATRIAQRSLERLKQPEGLAMPPEHREHVRAGNMYLIGLFCAVIGNARTLDCMKELDKPNHRSNAWRMRMVYELMHGRADAAADCQRRAELLALQDSGAVALPGTTTRIELQAAIYVDDVVGVKRLMERVEELAARYPGWQSTLAIARCHYRRLQGDLPAALLAARTALDLAKPARHYDWTLAIVAEVQVLNQLDRAGEALELGSEYLAIADRHDLRSARDGLTRVLADSYTLAGKLEEAAQMADEHLEALAGMGGRGIQLALAYETRARVAIAMHDETGVRRFAELCAQEYKGGRNIALSAKYRGLMREAEAAGVALTTGMQHAADLTALPSQMDAGHTLRSRLLTAVGSVEGAVQALRFLIESHGAVAGYLFAAPDRQLELLAAIPEEPPEVALVQALELRVATQALEPLLALSVSGGDADLDDVTGFDMGAGFDGATKFVPPPEPVGDGFEPVLLFANQQLVAVAALRYESQSRPVVPADVLEAFASALIQHGLC